MAIYLKKIFIGAGIVAGIMFILLSATVFYLKSDHALGVALSRINDRIPGSVLAEHHEVSFLKGEFGLQGLTLKNSFGDNLVGCEYFRVNISFIPLLKGELLITELFLENPRTTLKTDKDGHINLVNIFKDPGSVSKRDNDHGKKKKGIPLNIVIKSFTLVKGDFHYEMAKKDLVSALLDVNILANGDLQGQSGEILLNVKESYLKNQKFNINLTKPLKIQGTLNNGNIDPLLIQIGTAHSEIKVSGKIQDIFSKPVVDLQADLNLSLKEIQESLSRKPKLLGQVKGQLIVSGNIGEPSANLGLNIEEGIFFENTISQLTLDLKLDNYLIICDALKFNTMGSFVNLTGNIELAKVFPNGYLSSRNFFEELEYHASIKQENAQLEKLPWLKKRLKGTINAEIDIKGRGFSPDSLDAAGNLRLIARNIRADKIVSPVDAELETAIMIENGFLTIDCFDMRADKIRLDAAGSIDLKTRHIDSKLKIDAPDLETPLSAIGIKGVKGSVFLNADVTGGLENPLLDIMATGDNLSIPHVKIGDVVATGSFAGGKFKIEHALFQNNKSRLNIKGAVQIFEQDTLTVRKNPEFQVNISESTVFLEDLLDKVRGKIILSGHVSGSKEKPTGTLLLAGENIDLGVQVFSTVHLNLLLDEQKLWVTSMQAGISKNKTMEATGWLSLEKEYQIDLKSKGIALKEIDWIHDKSFLDGMLEFDFSGKGSIDDPQLRGDIFLTDFSVQGEELDDFHVHLDVKDHVAVVSGKIDADLKGVLDLADKEFTIDIECLDTDLAPYLNMFKMYNYSGLLSGKVQVKGNVNHLDRIQTAADISKFQIFNDSLKIADANPFRFFYTDKVVSIPGAKIFLLNDGQIEINGSADLDGPLSLKAHGRIPLHVLALFVEELPDIKGDVVVNAGMTGTIKKPDVKADLKISGLEFTIPELYQKLYNGDGTIHLTKETITIDEFKGKIDSGEFDLSGRIHIDEFKPVYLDVNLHANALPIHAPDTMDLLLTTDVNIKGTDEACVAKGEVILLEGLYYKDIKIKPLDLLKNAAKKKREEIPSSYEITIPFLKYMMLDMSVKQRNPFLVENNLAQLSVHTDVHVSGGITRPVIVGQTKVDEGIIYYLKKEFKVKSGKIDFINPYKTEPYINMRSEIDFRDWNIQLKLFGTQDQLGFELNSTPMLSHEDIVSLLLLGRTINENGNGQQSQSTNQMVAAMVAATIGKDIKKTTGLDIIEVDTKETEENNTDNENGTEADRIQVTLGKKLTKRLTMKYAVESKDGELNQEVISEYKFIENIIVNGFHDTKGTFGGEFIYRLEFR